MITLDTALLRRIAPAFKGRRAIRQASIIGAIGPVLAETLAKYAITAGLRAAHFLAQTCHESDGFCTTEEYASGEAYEGREDLGNTRPGDGVRYKGRGLIQLTGRANYAAYGKILGLDLLGKPELTAEPKTSLLVAGEFWTQHKLNALADKNGIIHITRRINGGLNGLADRRARLARAKLALGLTLPKATGQHPAHRHADQAAVASDIQAALRLWGLPIPLDGDFGPVTQGAVEQFQRANGLIADGIVGAQTWIALMLVR
jgi:putative chitinase